MAVRKSIRRIGGALTRAPWRLLVLLALVAGDEAAIVAAPGEGTHEVRVGGLTKNLVVGP